MTDSDFLNNEFFASERAWLIRQPDMQDWNRCTEYLRSVLVTCVSKTISTVCSEEHHPASKDLRSGATEFQRDCVQRVWVSLLIHWRRSQEKNRSVRVTQVLDALSQHRDLSNGKSMGGNPLEDVILAAAVCKGDGKAIQVMFDRYTPLARKISGDWNLARNSDTASVSNATPAILEEFCADAFMNQNVMGSYSGKNSLAVWLTSTLRNYANKKKVQNRKHEGMLQPDELLQQAPTSQVKSINSGELSDCETLLAKKLAFAIQQLKVDERDLLLAFFIKQRKNQDIAADRDLAPGHVSRLRIEAIRTLQANLNLETSEIRECGELVLGYMKGTQFGDVLVGLLSGGDIPDPPQSIQPGILDSRLASKNSRQGEG